MPDAYDVVLIVYLALIGVYAGLGIFCVIQAIGVWRTRPRRARLPKMWVRR